MSLLLYVSAVMRITNSLTLGYPPGAPLQVNLLRGAPSCRFFIAGEPRNKNDAGGYPGILAVIGSLHW